MYLEYFGFKKIPFSLVADPSFLYLSQGHRRVKANIMYAMNVQDSIVVCTGEIGTGKTTLINDALAQRTTESVIARIQVTDVSALEFKQMLLLEFGIEPYEFSKVEITARLKQFLLNQHRKGKKVVLFVDEAHLLDKAGLEAIRYLSDIEMNQEKVLSIILVGQPELNDTLNQPEMEHFLQRVRLRFHLKPLNVEDVKKYIEHRLFVAGTDNVKLFDDNCLPMIHQFTGGRLRLINTLCDYALMYCCVEKLPLVTDLVIQKAAHELQWESYEERATQQGDVTCFKMETPKKVVPNQASLVMHHKHQKQSEYKLNKDCMSIGRHMDNDIPIDDHRVSRNHAQVIVQSGYAYLHDLHSTNGTFLGKSKINLHQLRHGDEFVIGDYTFSYVDEAQRMDKVGGLDVQDFTPKGEPSSPKKSQPFLSLVE